MLPDALLGLSPLAALQRPQRRASRATGGKRQRYNEDTDGSGEDDDGGDEGDGELGLPARRCSPGLHACHLVLMGTVCSVPVRCAAAAPHHLRPLADP
jgi:hypothetical protein